MCFNFRPGDSCSHSCAPCVYNTSSIEMNKCCLSNKYDELYYRLVQFQHCLQFWLCVFPKKWSSSACVDSVIVLLMAGIHVRHVSWSWHKGLCMLINALRTVNIRIYNRMIISLNSYQAFHKVHSRHLFYKVGWKS